MCKTKQFLDSTGCSATEAQIKEIRIAENSSRISYVSNVSQTTTGFQCARFFSRHIFKSYDNKALSETIFKLWAKHNQTSVDTVTAIYYINRYLTKLRTIAGTYFPYFMENFKLEDYYNSTLDLASNVIDSDISNAHLHMDTRSSFPAILTAMNPIPSYAWTGGELFVSNGACAIDYAGGEKNITNNGDVIIMDADRLAHSVLPIVPVNKNHERNIVRISHVLYNNGPRSKK